MDFKPEVNAGYLQEVTTRDEEPSRTEQCCSDGYLFEVDEPFLPRSHQSEGSEETLTEWIGSDLHSSNAAMDTDLTIELKPPIAYDYAKSSDVHIKQEPNENPTEYSKLGSLRVEDKTNFRAITDGSFTYVDPSSFADPTSDDYVSEVVDPLSLKQEPFDVWENIESLAAPDRGDISTVFLDKQLESKEPLFKDTGGKQFPQNGSTDGNFTKTLESDCEIVAGAINVIKSINAQPVPYVVVQHKISTPTPPQDLPREELLGTTSKQTEMIEFNVANRTDSPGNSTIETSNVGGVEELCCTECNYKTALGFGQRMRYHHLTKHSGELEKKFCCNQCDYKTAFNWNLKLHMAKHSKAKKFSCDKCSFSTSHGQYLKVHISRHSLELRCNVCNFTTWCGRTLKRHEISHTKKFLCTICDYKAGDSSMLKRHTSMHGKEFSCSQCDFRTMQRESFMLHVSDQHPGLKEFYCPVCNYKTPSRSNLPIHVARHGVFCCTKCDFTTTRPDDLKIHTASEHIPVKEFKCGECDLKFPRLGELNVHMSKHTGFKKFSCTFCDYKCRQSGNLRVHMVRHTGIKEFTCEECGYKTAQRGTLKFHMRVHVGVKDYCCSQCDFKTAYKESLKRHVFLHAGIKKFTCSECDFKTAHPDSLREHMKKHKSVETIRCDECSFETARKCYLKRHKLLHTRAAELHCDECVYKTPYIGHLKRHTLRYHSESSTQVT